MKKILCLFFLLSALAGAAQTDTVTYRTFTAAELRDDLDTLYQQLQDNHPSLFAQWSKKDADKAFRQLRQGIGQPMNRLQFIRIVSPFLARFQDGHTFLSTEFDSEEFKTYGQQGGR